MLPTKASLTVMDLLAGGFERSGHWMLTATGDLALSAAMHKTQGVYAFANGDIVQYVGVATVSLAKRLYFYVKPGPTQSTSIRIKGYLLEALASFPRIDIYTARPANLEWNGLPVNASDGLEIGLIHKYALPWNRRSAG